MDIILDPHEYLQAAWDAWYDDQSPPPNPSALTYDDLDLLQHFDASGLPSEAHELVIREMRVRFERATPCPTCGLRKPE